MAIFRPSAIVGAISGNVGGVNFCNPSGSAVIRKAKTRTSPLSDAQRVASIRLLERISNWSDFSIEQKSAWNTAALQQNFINRLGVARKLSGYQFYLWANAIGDTNNPPVTNPAPPPPVLEFSSSVSAGMNLLITAVNPTDFNIGMIQAMPLFSKTPISSINYVRNIADLGIFGTGNLFWSTSYERIFGEPRLGQYIACRWRTINGKQYTGQEVTQVVQTTA